MNGPHDEHDALVGQWIEKAEDDFRASSQLLSINNDDDSFDVVCFHAQQCVEKYLKAVGVKEGKTIPRTHDLLELFSLMPDSVKKVLKSEELAELNPYAVEVRYPGFMEHTNHHDAVRALDLADGVRKACRNYLSQIID